MSDFGRVFVAVLLSVAAVWTAAAWGDDPHLELFNNQDEWEPLDDEVDLPVVQGPLVIPIKPTKPAVPPLFGAVSGILQDWKHSEDLPPSPPPVPPKRAVAGLEATQTSLMTQDAFAKEREFREMVTEAGVVPGTYRHILDVLSTGSVRTRPIKDR